MTKMRWLRIAALLSSLSFVTYGALIGSLPLVLMELMLLPINVWRLFELLRPRHRPVEVERA